MIKNKDVIEKQINIQYQMIGNEKYKDKIFKQSQIKGSDYIINKAFNHYNVPTRSILKPASKIYGNQFFTSPDGRRMDLKSICPIFFSPQIISWLYTVNPTPEDEIEILSEAFMHYQPLFEGLINQISKYSPHIPNASNGNKAKMCMPHQKIEDLILFDTYTKGSKYNFHPDYSGFKKHISNLSLSHLEHLMNVYEFVGSSEYFNIFGKFDSVKMEVERQYNLRLEQNNFDDLFKSNEGNKEKEGDTLNDIFDDLDI
jgi:hypothetical protein